MQMRPLGKTGLLVTPLGFGAFKIGRNEKVKYPQPYDLPDDAAAERLLNGVLDAGIHLIDSAPAYGISEERIGKFLASRRNEFVLSTKVGERFVNGESSFDFTAAGVRASVAESLRRLRTEMLDMVFVHSNGDDLAIQQQTEVVPTLQKMKHAGYIRAIGFSGKTPAGAEAALEWADVVMVEYHLHDTSHADVIASAASRGVGVVVKKGLSSGHLPPADAIRFVLFNPHVASVIVGGLSLEHLQSNIAAAGES
ncbi:MAG: aldo/keto reductase [Planctomycetaceae bacterium]|nr:aldo/keto reductase [Planctomycetaceae bacterium]